MTNDGVMINFDLGRAQNLSLYKVIHLWHVCIALIDCAAYGYPYTTKGCEISADIDACILTAVIVNCQSHPQR